MISDVAIVGAGAGGLMTAITAKRAGVPRVLLLDTKEKIGAKILMSGGTRCNITNENVTEADFQSEQKNIVKSVLKFFPSEKAVQFFNKLGVSIVREEGGKYFPSTHSGRTVLEALEKETQRLGIDLETPRKVTEVRWKQDHFVVLGKNFSYESRCVVLTTGGLSYPSTGSDGAGYDIARSFGHRLIETTPSLTPLVSEDPDFKALAGVSLPARLTLRFEGKKKAAYEGSFLFTHFGFSGPVVLNISRHWIRESRTALGFPPKACGNDSEILLEANFLPERAAEQFEKKILQQIEQNPGKSVKSFLAEFLPQRFAEMMLKKAGIRDDIILNQLKKSERQRLRQLLFACPLPVREAVGYQKAEVTAGGVDLAEVRRQTLESKLQLGLFFAGEILDVDGRIGGFNFQWAWSSGVVAGLGVAEKAANVSA